MSKKDDAETRIQVATVKLGALRIAQTQAAERLAQIDKIRDTPDYQAAISKIANNYAAMTQSRVINEKNKASFARPVSDAFRVPVEQVINDALKVSEKLLNV
jgi:hypothetical protein